MPPFDRAHFERLYESDPDPWKFRSSAYEERKYAATMASLTRPRYTRGLELGCSIGVLTQRLAGVCDQLVAVDTSMCALTTAREACRHTNVTFKRTHLPESDWGEGFDLVVLSEILYYLDAPALGLLAERIGRSIVDGAECLAVHWTGETDYPLSGDRAYELFRSALPGCSLASCRTPCYRLDSWSITAPAASVKPPANPG
jgi:hypothetical protein